MKKALFIVMLICVSLTGFAQTDSTHIESNPYISAVNHVDWKEMGWQVSEYSYGFLKQGANTVEGAYNSLKELPDVLHEIKDLDVIDFGSFVANSVYEGAKNTVNDYLTGDPEKAGAAAFDVFMIIEGGRSLSRAGKGAASKYGPKYHYTSAEAAENIKNTGIKPGRSGEVFTTYDGSLSGTEAQSKLALPHETPPTTRVTIDASVSPEVFREVEPAFGQVGGGMEQIYYAEIGADKIISVTPIEMEASLLTQVAHLTGEASYYAPGAMMTSLDDNEDNKEGGHKLTAHVGLVFITDDSIPSGGFKLLDKNETRYVVINPDDIDRLTPDFIGCLSGSNDTITHNPTLRSRDDVITGNRESRGL